MQVLNLQLQVSQKSLALELAEKNFNIRVNCINPGFTKTSYFNKFKKIKNCTPGL